MTNAALPPTVRYELRRASAFVAVFTLMEALDVDPDVYAPLVTPYDRTISWIVDEFPEAEPVVSENPVDIIRDDIEQMDHFEFEPLAEYIDLVEEFYDENSDQLPTTLDYDGPDEEGRGQ